MLSVPDENWSFPTQSDIPSMDDMNALNEKAMSGLEGVLSILDQALAEFDEAVSKIGSTSRN